MEWKKKKLAGNMFDIPFVFESLIFLCTLILMKIAFLLKYGKVILAIFSAENFS